MTQWPPRDLYVEAKLLGILLSGVLGQTRAECSAESRLRLDLRPGGGSSVVVPDPERDPER